MKPSRTVLGCFLVGSSGAQGITEFSAGTTGTRLSDITNGPDGNLWFTDIGGDRIGRITPLAVVTLFNGAKTITRLNY